MGRPNHHQQKKKHQHSTQSMDDGNSPEWESRSMRGQVNRLCACGAVPEVGLICNRCRTSNEFRD